MKKELVAVRRKIEKLIEKQNEIDEELKILRYREEELENEEVIAVFRKANISLEEVMEKFNHRKKEVRINHYTNMEGNINE